MRSLALMEAAPRSGGSGLASLPWPARPDASPTAGSPARLYHAAMRESELHTATTECLLRFAAVLDAMWGLEPRSHHDHRPQRYQAKVTREQIFEFGYFLAADYRTFCAVCRLLDPTR